MLRPRADSCASKTSLFLRAVSVSAWGVKVVVARDNLDPETSSGQDARDFNGRRHAMPGDLPGVWSAFSKESFETMFDSSDCWSTLAAANGTVTWCFLAALA